MTETPRRRTIGADHVCIAVLAVLPALFLAPSLFGGKVLLPADLMLLTSPWRDAGKLQYPQFRFAHNGMFDPLHQHYPWKVYLSRSYRAGRIPLWNPYVYGGQPFAATGQTAVFYPPNALFALIDPARAFGYLAFFHLFLAGLGLYALARGMGCRPAASLAGAISFQLCGIFVVTLEFTSYLATMAWLPLVVLALRRVALGGGARWAALAGGAIGLQLLAGHMQYAVYSLATAVVCTAFFLLTTGAGRAEVGRRALTAALPFGLGVAIAALHILPCLEMGLLSARRGVGTYAGALTQAMPARQLLALLIPDPLGNPVDCGEIPRYIENYPYLGLGVLFLVPAALFGRRRREGWLCAGLLAAGLLLAFGTHLNWLLFKLVPGFSQLTGLGRAIYIAAFGGGLGAALGVEAMIERCGADPVWGRKYVKGAGAAAFAATAVLVGFGLMVLDSPKVPELLAPFYQKVMRQDLATPEVLAQARSDARVVTSYAVDAFLGHLGRRVAVFLALVTALLAGTVALGRQEGLVGRGAPWVFAAVIAADLFGYGCRFNPQLPRGMLSLESSAIEYLQQVQKPARIASVAADGNPLHRLPPNLGMVYDLEEVNGSDSLMTKAYMTLLTRAGDPKTPGFLQPDVTSPVADLLGVRYVATDANLDAVRGFRRVVEGPFRVYENERACPRVWSVGDTTSVPDYATALEAVVRCTPGPCKMAMVVGEPPRSRGVAGTVHLSRYEAQRVSVEGTMPAGSWVILDDAYYPGWRAWADGAPAAVRRVDYILRGVHLERDATRVEFAYRPASLIAGEFVTCLALAMMAGMLVGSRRRREPR